LGHPNFQAVVMIIDCPSGEDPTKFEEPFYVQGTLH
jgi:hypothetical protein